MGHLRRCLTLARELQKENCLSHLICRLSLDLSLEAHVQPFSLHWLRGLAQSPDTDLSDELRDADATLDIIRGLPTAPSWVVLDSYRYACAWEKRVRDAGHQVLVIEDYRHRKHHADLLVSDSEVPVNPASNSLAVGRILAGRAYALLDTEYAYTGQMQLKATNRKRLLISYGGADLTQETAKALEAVCKLRSDPEMSSQVGRVDVVVGPANPHSVAILRSAQRVAEVFVHQSLYTLAPLMRHADLVLTSGGNTMVEALALRKPCIVTVTGNNQTLMVNDLDSEGVIRCVGGEVTVNPGEVLTMMRLVLNDFDAFASRIASKSVFDHFGAKRIVSAMLELSETSRAHMRESECQL